MLGIFTSDNITNLKRFR